MRISTKGRYGLEALVMLCLESEQEPVSLKKIAEGCNISEAYILQIFLVLRRAGIVESIRGAQGGYILHKKASEITAGEVIQILEGPMSPVSCIVENCMSPCSRFKACATRLLWEKIMNELETVSRSITLSELADCYREMNNQKYMEDYCI